MCPVRLSSLSPTKWQPKRLKFYPHFDRFLSMHDAVALATDPVLVSKRAFFPFILFEESWKKFGVGGHRQVREKTHPIQYAARGDAYIYEYYRYLLSIQYERKLLSEGISHIPIAYRKIRNANGAGSSNVDFAHEAFEKISQQRAGYVIALDIKGFFNNISHQVIKFSWTKLIDADRLPADHFAVFKAITKHSSVKKQDVYNALGIPLSATRGAQIRRVKQDIAQCQICTTDEFRQKICKARNMEGKIVVPNKSDRGIPQGSAISDILANLAMFDFDILMNKFCVQNAIYYRRYSDDLIFILPENLDLKNEILNLVKGALRTTTKTLEISESKTRIHHFIEIGNKIKITSLEETKGPIEYLGFQFDGRYALFRNSTLSNISRRIKKTSYALALDMVKKYRASSVDVLLNGINMSSLAQKFFKIKDFEPGRNYSDMNFYSYAKIAERRMGKLGKKLIRQIARLRKTTISNFEKIIRSIFEKATNSAAHTHLAPAPAA